MSYQLHPEDLIELAEMGFRATYHRLRGVRGVVAGWIEIGIPEEQKPRILSNLAKEQELILRLDEMHQAACGRWNPADAALGVRPAIFLSACLQLGTPEEGGELMPSILKTDGALALATWFLQRGCGEEKVQTSLRVENGIMTAHVQNSERSAAPSWPTKLKEYIVEEDPFTLKFNEGVFSFPEKT
jgi:hypothetical protein